MPIFVSKSASIKLTEEQLKKIFKDHDSNKDGRLSKEELSNAFRKMGYHKPGRKVNRAMKHADINKDGVIDQSRLQGQLI
ncbi:Calcium-binding EF-hand [Corchorus capsularis]|uniref:Calcium-binding EF-hand n=1 Tax=Corchorus capsularis TaxID=210143 RepID=A0A1R3I8R6_COCAP|nr:Calcium-binding EF-hand [Corchorus capsularis]